MHQDFGKKSHSTGARARRICVEFLMVSFLFCEMAQSNEMMYVSKYFISLTRQQHDHGVDDTTCYLKDGKNYNR